MSYMVLRHALYSALTLLVLPVLSGSAAVTAAPTSQTPTPSSRPPQQSTRPILLTDPVPDPKQQGVLYFSATGHTLRGAFLDYWNKYGGLAQFGYPLTEEFFEPVGADNKMYQVQYFERNRFELHPENAGTPYEVLLGTLGREFRTQDPPASPISGATYFRETGHNLSGAFKQYWDTHGGLFVHGYPITEAVMERSTNGKEYLVQWFERSRFELHPENAGSPHEVLLGLLGRQLSEKKGYPYGWYPLHGRAPDFSWISGQLDLHEPYTTLNNYTGCNILRYEQSERGSSVQLDGQGWAPFIRSGRPSQPPVRRGDYLVVFGHRAHADERYWYCVVNPSPGYIVDKVQTNPTQ